MEKSEQAHRIGNGTRLNRQFDELAKGMAGLAHKIRDLTVAAFEYTTVSGAIQKLFASFKEVSNADLTELQFADMFAQTLAYGLFATIIQSRPVSSFNMSPALYRGRMLSCSSFLPASAGLNCGTNLLAITWVNS